MQVTRLKQKEFSSSLNLPSVKKTEYNLSPFLILGVGRGNVASLHSGFAEKVEYLAGDASIWSDLTGSCKLPTKPCLLLRETTHLVPRALGLPFLLSLYQRCAYCATERAPCMTINLMPEGCGSTGSSGSVIPPDLC